MKKLTLLAILGLAPALTAVTANADPWPSLNASQGTLSFVQVTATETSPSIWEFDVCVDASAPIGGIINVGGIKALAVYVNNGDPGPDLGSWGQPSSFDGLTTLATWGFNGGYEIPKGAFGYLTGSPDNYVHKGDCTVVGTADFNGTGFNLNLGNTAYLVHLDWGYFREEIQGNTAWYGPGVPEIPEPATMLLLGSGLLGAAGFARIRRKK